MKLVTLILLSLLSFQLLAMPTVDQTCLGNGKPLEVMNDQVIKWKTTTPDTFHSRARIEGTIDQVFPDQTGHRHFSLKIGPNQNDHIEVIYNLSFGNLPVPRIGDTASACGDYITALGRSGGYPPSPDGAIIHWVHKSNNPKHEPGYVILNGQKF